MILYKRPFIYLLILSSFCWWTCSAQQNAKETAQHIHKEHKQGIVSKLKENGHLSISEQTDLYRQLKADYPEAYNFENEDELTMYGYGMLWDDRPSDALVIFQLIAEQFPESSNAYDSLGEAYYVLGKKDLALQNYKKSLSMNPDNYNAEDYIDLIKHPDRKPKSLIERFTEVYSIQAYREDLDDLAHKLIKTHPGIFKFTSEEAFRQIVEKNKLLIDEETTYGMFRWYCSEIISAVNCAHTGMGGFYPENEMLPDELRFPLQTMWIEGHLYIVDPLSNASSTSKQDEILSINGIPSNLLIDDIYEHIQSQGHIETTKRLFFNKWSTSLIPYALGFPESYVIAIRGKDEPILLKETSWHNDPIEDSTITNCNQDLCLDFFSSNDALLSIKSFIYYRWNNYDEFVSFMDDTFVKLETKKTKNLIIDLRGNGGGAPEASIYLLRYLTEKPFIYFPDVEPIRGGGIQEPFNNGFKGHIYFLIDGWGNSTTGHFMAMIKEMGIGTIIGEELGSNQFCTAGQTIFKLKNTRLQFESANNQNRVSVTSLPDERGILPDHYVQQNIHEYLHRIDAVKNYAMGLITQQTNNQ